jgi:hypothetical protein
MPKVRKPQRQSYNSVDSQVKANMEAGVVPDYPKGVNYHSESDIELWRCYTSIRINSDWRDADLLTVVKMIQYENDINSINLILEREGMLIENDKGNLIEHPGVKARNSMVNQLLAMGRSLKINDLPSDPSTVNAHGKKAADKAKTKSKVALLASL